MQHASPPTEKAANTTLNDATEPVADTPSLAADLAVLIAEIEAAAVGSAALDARIHFGFRVAAGGATDIAALLIADGITWPTVEAVMDARIPAFTTSLDASLDGEDITFVVRSAKRGRWGAMQKAHCGEEVMAWGATEPLARRLAALRACLVDIEKSTAGSQNSLPATLPTHEPADAASAEPKDWEITF